MKEMLRRLVREEEGQDLVEYALLVALIAIVCVLGVTAFGSNLAAFYESITGQIPLPTGGA